MKLQARLTLTNIIIYILVLSLVIFTFESLASALIVEDSKADTLQLISYGETLSFNYVNSVQLQLGQLASSPEVIAAIENNDKALLENVSETLAIIKSANPRIENIGILDSECTSRAADQKAAPFVGQNFSSREYCIGTLQTKEPYVSSAFISVVTKKPVLSVASPVKKMNGEMVGLIVATIDTTRLSDGLKIFDPHTTVILLDRMNRPFFDSSRQITQVVSSQEDAWNGQEDEIKTVNQKIQNGETTGFFELKSSQRNDFVAFRKGDFLTIIIQESSSNAFAVVYKIRELLLFTGVIALILLVVSSWFVSRSVAGPIQGLTRDVEAISRGQLDIELKKR